MTGLAQSYEQLLAFRSLGGLGSSMFSVSAGSLLMRSVSDEFRARAQSLFNGGFLLSFLLKEKPLKSGADHSAARAEASGEAVG